MHRYQAHIHWQRDGAVFSDLRYSRAHTWSFDGGVTVNASASPSIVPLPYSRAEAVDPEEALVAAVSSCHMLWFLSLAAERGVVVDSYEDDAYGVMETDAQGRQAITRIVLQPLISFLDNAPPESELEALHDSAHDCCFIANSLKSEIVVKTPSG